jgi:hypothetical protein
MPRAKLSLVERLYLPEIAKGLALTSRHFFVNLWYHTLASLWRRWAWPGGTRPW